MTAGSTKPLAPRDGDADREQARTTDQPRDDAAGQDDGRDDPAAEQEAARLGDFA